VNRIRSRAGKRRQARIGAPDRSLTPNAGLAVVSELCSRLGLIGALDAAVGPIKQRERGHGAGELLAGIAAAQLAGEDFLTGLDRQRADAAGQQLTPVPGLSSTTAAGLARRITPGHPRSVAGSGRRSGGRDRADAGTAPGAGIIAKEHGRTPADDAQEIRPSTRGRSSGPSCLISRSGRSSSWRCSMRPPLIGGDAWISRVAS
jgi:hypothetical protein